MSGWSRISTVSLSRRGMMSVLEHALLQGGRVVFDHPDVGRGRSVWLRQSVGIERRAPDWTAAFRHPFREPRLAKVLLKTRLVAPPRGSVTSIRRGIAP